jgi:hypothetical protein
MKNDVRTDGLPPGKTGVASLVAITPLRPALASIREACRYLGDLSRSRLYELMPHLDVVHIGARSFVTVESLDRLISVNRRTAVAQLRGSGEMPVGSSAHCTRKDPPGRRNAPSNVG